MFGNRFLVCFLSSSVTGEREETKKTKQRRRWQGVQSRSVSVAGLTKRVDSWFWSWWFEWQRRRRRVLILNETKWIFRYLPCFRTLSPSVWSSDPVDGVDLQVDPAAFVSFQNELATPPVWHAIPCTPTSERGGNTRACVRSLRGLLEDGLDSPPPSRRSVISVKKRGEDAAERGARGCCRADVWLTLGRGENRTNDSSSHYPYCVGRYDRIERERERERVSGWTR
ncbi:hypothetical protein LZ31DRAFT_275634 [Colletotrichum somersetense]|nr:hypothetical protein LZ31DRAFT_275634 [Colletotrichum somersetense]